ncbi:Dip2/Utp12 family-domain-containing protein [Aspergillus californicus]
MGKKSAQKPASKTSTASLAVADFTTTGNQSSILKASFAPSDYQLALFASVIHGLDGQNLRIHDTNTGRLQCEHGLAPKELVTSLDWGYYAGRKEQTKKKRKRHSDVNGTNDGLDQGDVVVAFGTNTSDIRMYSPAEDKIIGTLTGGHTGGVKDFKFTADQPQEGWSIGGDNKLVQWDLITGQRTKVINLPTSTTFTALSRPLRSNPPVICASHTPSIINTEDESTITFPAMRNSIQTILTSSTKSASDGLFLASDNDRFINVFDPETRQLAMNLVAEREVTSLSLYTKQGADVNLALEKQFLAAVTVDGTIELFARPFVKPREAKSPKSSNSLRAKSMQMTRRAEASLKITKSDSSSDLVPVVSVSFQGPDLLIAWAHGGIVPLFERVKWLNEDTEELVFTGVKTIAKTKSSSILSSVTTNGTKDANESHVNENKIVVEQGNLADDDIDMEDRQDAVSVDDSDVDSEDDDQPKQQKVKEARHAEEPESDVDMQNAAESGAEDEDDEDEEATGEPSFGELMRAHAAEEIDVEAELEDDVHTRSLIPGKPITTVQQIPSGVSLSTVLTQSLKTNDNDMLEACFHTGDAATIRTTIQRLDSPLAATLLQRLAERLSARPGRYGHLLVWVQWTCIAHGGALAGNKELLKQMSTLFKVMDQRSSTLPSLLLLKGKLDMLDAQLGLRQSLRENADHLDSEDEENVIYVEGYDDEEDENSDAETAKNIETPRTKAIRDQTDISMVDEDEEVSEDDDDEEDDDEEDDEAEAEASNVLDVEAEESAGSSDAEESLGGDDDENEDDDADSGASIADFIADTEDDSDAEDLSRPPPSKRTRYSQGGGKGKKQAGSGRK